MKRVRPSSLKLKVLFGVSFLTLIVVASCLYSAIVFKKLERRMEMVNDLYMPAVKALTQIESSYFLLESDLDKSLQEGILRPKDTLESILNSRLDFLNKSRKETKYEDQILGSRVDDLMQSYISLENVLSRVYENWTTRDIFAEELSLKRADFRQRFKGLIRDLDRETRLASLAVQSDINRLGIILTIVIVFFSMSAFLLAAWLAKSLRPVERLARIMRSISEMGLTEGNVRELAELPQGSDEIGTLSDESYKMATSLLDKNKLFSLQKQNLERAHADLARQNLELRKTQNRLLHSEKLGLVGKLAAQMAHEIRNPLNALNLHTDILEDQLGGNRSANESIGPIRKEINRLISVTESYLDLARAPKLDRDQIRLNEIIEELYDLYAPLLKEKGIFFTCDLSDIPAISADRSQIMQVVGNLIKNASEAFDETKKDGGKFIRLFTNFNSETNEISFSVMDNGIGISPAVQTQIFSPFFTSKAQGTGLGLAFSKQVVEEHGGEISFDSSPNSGTKFTVKIPLNM